MLFELFNDIQTKQGDKGTWIEAGTYPVVRYFDKERVLIDVGIDEASVRQLTVVKLTKGTLINVHTKSTEEAQA